MDGFNFRLDTSDKRKIKVVDQKKISMLKDQMETDVQFQKNIRYICDSENVQEELMRESDRSSSW